MVPVFNTGLPTIQLLAFSVHIVMLKSIDIGPHFYCQEFIVINLPMAQLDHTKIFIIFNLGIQYNTGGCPAAAVPSVLRVSKILHPTCSAYISLNNGPILMFKVSKRPCRSSLHDEIICRWRHNPPGGENLN